MAAARDRRPSSRSTTSRRTIVVGLGNPLLGDDGVGWVVVDRLADVLASRGIAEGAARAGGAAVAGTAAEPAGVELDRLAVGGLTLMERLAGYDRAILVDALVTGRAATGSVTVVALAELAGRSAAHLDSAHDAPLTAALRAGRALGADLPSAITVVGIEADRVDTFGEALSDAVGRAVPVAVDRVMRLLEERATTARGVASRPPPADGPNAAGGQAEGPLPAGRPALVWVGSGTEAVDRR